MGRTLQTVQEATAPLIISCSPRQGGNCDAAASIFSRVASKACGLEQPAQVVYLRQHPVSPCVSCSCCADQSRSSLYEQALQGSLPFWNCPCSIEDDSTFLLRRMALAASICIIAPIFFYHLPAQLKALIDRLQPAWMTSTSVEETGGFPFIQRRCHSILIAGRPQGEQLFAGSLLTMKYALGCLHLSQEEPLLLRGYDAPGSLAADPSAVFAIEKYAADAGGSL